MKDEKFNIYKAIDSFIGRILVIDVDKKENGNRYLSTLRQILAKSGKGRLIIVDRRTCFVNGLEESSHVTKIIENLDI